jgi:hypothetical protein
MIDVARGKNVAKAGRKKEGETPAVLRCDKLATFMNPGKERHLHAMLRSWRLCQISMEEPVRERSF